MWYEHAVATFEAFNRYLFASDLNPYVTQGTIHFDNNMHACTQYYRYLASTQVQKQYYTGILTGNNIMC